MESHIVTENEINEDLAELRFRMARLEEMKDGKIRTGQRPVCEKDDRMYDLSFQFFLRLK